MKTPARDSSLTNVCIHTFLTGLTDDIGEDEVPACDKSPQLADRHVAVEVRGASLGHPSTKLGVAQTSQDRSQGSDEEGEDDRRSRAVPGHGPCQDIHAGAQRAADAQGHQVERVEASGEVGVLGAAVHNFHPQELRTDALQCCHYHLAARRTRSSYRRGDLRTRRQIDGQAERKKTWLMIILHRKQKIVVQIKSQIRAT